jgi:hypothetical protein
MSGHRRLFVSREGEHIVAISSTESEQISRIPDVDVRELSLNRFEWALK